MQQFRRGVAHFFGGFAFRLFPVAAPERVQRGVRGVVPRVARNEVQICDRHVKACFLFVFDFEEFALAFARFHVYEPAVAPDPVVDVHDCVAHFEFGHVAHHHLNRIGRAGAARAIASGTRGVEFRFGKKREFFKERPRIKRGDRKAEHGLARPGTFPVGVFLDLEAARAKEFSDRLEASRRRGRNEHAPTARFFRGNEVFEVRQGFRVLSIDRRARKSPLRGRVCGSFDREAREAPETHEKLFVREPECLGRQGRPHGVRGEKFRATRHVGAKVAKRLRDVARKQYAGRGGKVVGERCRLVEKEGQVVFDPRAQHPFFGVRVDDALFGVARKDRAPALPEKGERFGGHGEFVPGKKPNFLDHFHRTLRVDVEPPDRVDLVVEKIESEGVFGPHRVDVDDAPAHGEFSRREYLFHGGVARPDEVFAKPLDRNPIAPTQKEGVGADESNGRHALRGRDGGGDENVRTPGAACKSVEGFEALRHEVFLRTQRIVGERFPVGQRPHVRFGSEPGALLRKTPHVRGVRAHDENSFAAPACFETRFPDRRGGKREAVLRPRSEREEVGGKVRTRTGVGAGSRIGGHLKRKRETEERECGAGTRRPEACI